MITLRYPGWVKALGLGGGLGFGAVSWATGGDSDPRLPVAMGLAAVGSAVLLGESLWFHGEADGGGVRVRNLRGHRSWAWSELRATLVARAGNDEVPTDALPKAMALVVWGPAGQVRFPWHLDGFAALVAEARRRGRLGVEAPPVSPALAAARGVLQVFSRVADGFVAITSPLTMLFGVALAGLVGFMAVDLAHLDLTGDRFVDTGLWAGAALSTWVAVLFGVAVVFRRTTALRDTWELGFRTAVAMLGMLLGGGGVVGMIGGAAPAATLTALGVGLTVVAAWPGRRAR